MKRLAIVMAVVLVLLAVPGVAGYLAFVRGPRNTPAEACGKATKPVVVAAGASITQGTLGGDWVGAVRDRHPEHEVVNAGVNGNTSADLKARIKKNVLDCAPTAVVILVGTNDVRANVPLDQYRANLKAIVEDVKNARIALLSLPPLGEDPGTEINRTLAGYNAVIKEVAEQTEVDYLPVHERMTAIKSDGTPYDFNFATALSAATQHYVFARSWDDVAKSGGRELLIDHVHLSDRGAAVIADLVSEWL